MTRDKRSWKRKLNFNPDGSVVKVYGFSEHLKKIGDTIETLPMTMEERNKFKYAAYIWAYRHNCRVVTRTLRCKEGKYLRLTVVDNRRR